MQVWEGTHASYSKPSQWRAGSGYTYSGNVIHMLYLMCNIWFSSFNVTFYSLFQVQKLKLDTETWVFLIWKFKWIFHIVLIPQHYILVRAMLELNQILRANEINFAVLTALPAFFLSLLLMMLVRGWFKQVISLVWFAQNDELKEYRTPNIIL